MTQMLLIYTDKNRKICGHLLNLCHLCAKKNQNEYSANK